MNLLVGISQATRCCRQDMAFCEGVTFQQFVILDALAKNNELNISDLHGILSVKKSTTTRLVNPLIQKGLVTREKSRLDSRSFVLSLTKEGKNVQHSVRCCLADFLNSIELNLPAGKKDNVLQAVQIFIDAIKNASGVCNCCR
ncbi:MAG: MarR family transcriptional regulator [Smithellaceae bacterium]|nr:MarR family transcriptional regulator [Smithellaceae bacterium]